MRGPCPYQQMSQRPCLCMVHLLELSSTCVGHRLLCRYAWDVKEEVGVLKEFAAWLHSPLSEGEHPPKSLACVRTCVATVA